MNEGIFAFESWIKYYPPRLFANKSEGKYQVKLVLNQSFLQICQLYSQKISPFWRRENFGKNDF